MAPNCDRQETSLLLQPPKFFKIVFDRQAQTLRIPTKFTEKYGKILPNSITLKVGNGSVLWKVELIRCNGETLIQRGWLEFKEYYSLDFGHLLVFEYVGKSYFNVSIFDTSAMEIEYPNNRTRTRNNSSELKQSIKPEPESESDSDYVVVSDEYNKEGKNAQSAIEKYDDVSLKTLDNPSARHQEIRKRAIGRLSIRASTITVDPKTSLAYQMATVFMSDKKSRNPFFISPMQPSYISTRFSLQIPLSFVKENLPLKKQKNLILCNLKAKRWPVRYSVSIGKAYITAGWKKFAQDNKLKVGDACVFEVTKTAKPEWNVIIFRS